MATMGNSKQNKTKSVRKILLKFIISEEYSRLDPHRRFVGLVATYCSVVSSFRSIIPWMLKRSSVNDDIFLRGGYDVMTTEVIKA
jgi:hypothetical protein